VQTQTVYYAYIGLTDVNSSNFVWTDGNTVAYSNLSGKYMSLKLFRLSLIYEGAAVISFKIISEASTICFME